MALLINRLPIMFIKRSSNRIKKSKGKFCFGLKKKFYNKLKYLKYFIGYRIKNFFEWKHYLKNKIRGILTAFDKNTILIRRRRRFKKWTLRPWRWYWWIPKEKKSRKSTFSYKANPLFSLLQGKPKGLRIAFKQLHFFKNNSHKRVKTLRRWKKSLRLWLQVSKKHQVFLSSYKKLVNIYEKYIVLNQNNDQFIYLKKLIANTRFIDFIFAHKIFSCLRNQGLLTKSKFKKKLLSKKISQKYLFNIVSPVEKLRFNFDSIVTGLSNELELKRGFFAKIFTKSLKEFMYRTNKRPQKPLLTRSNFYTKYKHFINIFALPFNVKSLQKIKKLYKNIKRKECRKLRRIASFFRSFGFRRNKNRKERPLRRTKLFKKFILYRKIIRLFSHKVSFAENNIYPVQAFKFKLSYYKMRWQLGTYFLQNYLAKGLTRNSLAIFSKKSKTLQKNQLINFTTQIEFKLATILLRMRLLATTGMAYQFIRHGYVFVNYKKIIYPNFIVKAGDTVSIYVNVHNQSYHRFHDPVYSYRLCPGLYRRNSGRQSPITNEQPMGFIKSGLSYFNKWHNSNLFHFRKRVKAKLPIWSPHDRALDNKYKLIVDSSKFAGWKHSFVVNQIDGNFINHNSYIDKISNVLI